MDAMEAIQRIRAQVSVERDRLIRVLKSDLLVATREPTGSSIQVHAAARASLKIDALAQVLRHIDAVAKQVDTCETTPAGLKERAKARAEQKPGTYRVRLKVDCGPVADVLSALSSQGRIIEGGPDHLLWEVEANSVWELAQLVAGVEDDIQHLDGEFSWGEPVVRKDC